MAIDTYTLATALTVSMARSTAGIATTIGTMYMHVYTYAYVYKWYTCTTNGANGTWQVSYTWYGQYQWWPPMVG